MKNLVLSIFVIFLISMSISLTIADNSDETYTYENRRLGFSLNHPSGIGVLWESIDEVGFDTIDLLNVGSGRVLIRRTHLTSKPLEDFIKDQIPEKKYGKSNTEIVAGKQVYVFANVSTRFLGTSAEYDLYREVWVFEHNGYAYRIYFITSVRYYEEINAEYFEPMKKSFRLTSLSEPILTLTPPTVIPTPTPSLSPTSIPSPISISVLSPTPDETAMPEKDVSGFEVIFAIVGLSVVAYFLRKRKAV